ncbi:ATP-binding protein [Candidatus Parcubacteria bacterium]|nr:MAG: ATP-binding protein [Candidatus Parcubacteria bacterium]
MNRNFENPFADYGTIVHGERFIGRKNDLQVIESRVIRPQEPGNLAIIGDSRIGKSSLAYKAVIDRKDELIAKRLLPIWFNLSGYDRAPVFFRSLVTRCIDELEELGWLSLDVQQSAVRALQDEMSWSEGYSRIQRFFEKVRKEGIRVLFILDEFDHARHLFREDISAFQGLRELSYRPEWRVSYIITSRRTIRDIELQTQTISTLDGIFHKHYLGMFDTDGIEEYFGRLASVGISDDLSLREKIAFYCGGHPYLLELLGYEVVELFREEHVVDIDKAARRSMPAFLSQYDRMRKLLREEGRFDKILQILVGPVVNVKWTDVENLLKYGFIQQDNQGTYTAFSEHFQTYLEIIERQFDWDLWPMWRRTEKALRQLITRVMREKYGDNWIDALEKAKPKLRTIFDRCREVQAKEKRVYGNRASSSLIDFTYPQELFNIIFAEWNIFKEIFGQDKAYWAQRSELLAKIRNPYAHNRDEVVYDYERQIAEGYCQEILAVVKQAGAE